MVVLHPLPGRKMIVNQTRPNPTHLVGAHRRPHAAPADRDTSLDLSGGHRTGHRKNKIRKIVPRIDRVRAEIYNLVAGTPQALEQLLLQSIAAMIRCDSKFHNRHD